MHEPLSSFRKVSAGSNRKFGVVVGLILAVLAVWPLLRHHQAVRWWLLVPGVLLVAAGLAAPDWLTPLNKAWFRLGLLLNKIVSPVIMGLMFFAAVVPIGFILRKRGHDLLRLRSMPDAETYWIPREPPAPAPGSLSKQF